MLADSDLTLASKDGRFKIDPIGMAKNNSCATNTNFCPRGNRKLWAVHNFIMWLAWVIFTAMILSSARYFRHYWRRSIYIHATLGILVFLITTAGVLMAWSRNPARYGTYMHWTKWSSFFENIATFVAWFVCLTGMFSWFYRRYGTYEWGTTNILNVGKVHRYSSQILIFFIQGLIIFAIIDNFGFTK